MILSKYGLVKNLKNWINIQYICARNTICTNGFFSEKQY